MTITLFTLRADQVQVFVCISLTTAVLRLHSVYNMSKRNISVVLKLFRFIYSFSALTNKMKISHFIDMARKVIATFFNFFYDIYIFS